MSGKKEDYFGRSLPRSRKKPRGDDNGDIFGECGKVIIHTYMDVNIAVLCDVISFSVLGVKQRFE